MADNLLVAPPRTVLRKNTARRFSYGHCSPHYMATVRKWRQHFRGVAISIYKNAKQFRLPVNFEPIESYLSGFEVAYHAITDLPPDALARYRAKDEIEEGWNLIDQGVIHIFIDPTMPVERVRMTVAHEWGHVLQKIDGEFRKDMEAIRDPEERARIIEAVANKFASDYLIPEPVLRYRCIELQELPVAATPRQCIESLAHAFNVSFVAMQYHLDYCRIPYKR